MDKKISMRNKSHLPIFGPGPFYVFFVIALTAVGIFCSKKNYIPVLHVAALSVPLSVMGYFLIAEGLILYYYAVIKQRINRAVKDNKMVTKGVYAYVRNPVYSAFMFLCSGILFLFCNLYLLFLPILFWIFLTILMRFTEERWLLNLYGEKYTEYYNQVNRAIPWIRRKRTDI